MTQSKNKRVGVINFISSHATKIRIALLIISLLGGYLSTKKSSSIPVAASLEVTKTVSNSTPLSGESFSYNIQYSCVSLTDNCTGTYISDPLPPEVEFVAVNGTAHTTNEQYDPITHTVTFTFQDPLIAGSTGEVSIIVRFPNGTTPNGTVASNSASIHASNASTVFSNIVTSTAQAFDRMYAEKSYDGGVLDQEIIYGFTVCNDDHDVFSDGTLNATSITLVDTLPANATFNYVSSGGVYDAVSHTVTWSYPTDLEYGQCWWPTVSVTFSSADYAVGDSVLNTGHLSYTPIGESPTTISTSVMLYFEAAKTEGSLSKTPYSSTRIQGEWGRYKIKFKNTSNIPIDNFYIEDIIPAGITITHFNTGGFYGLGGLQFSIKYTTNLNPVWTTSPGSPYNQNSNATENVSTYGLASNEYITGLRWDFSPGQFAIGSGLKSSQAIYINYNVNKDAPLGDITNCVTAGGDAITYSLTNANSCATFEVLPGINGFVSAPRKDFKERTCNCWTYFSSDYYNVGDTLSFRLQMENHITSSTNIPNPSLADLLPNGLTYIDGSWAFENSGYVVPAPTFTKTVNHNGTGRTLLKWDWTGYSLGPDTTFFVTFDAVIGIASPSGAGGLVNEYAILQYDNNGCTSGNIQKADTFDLDGDGNTTEEFCFAKTEININEFFSLESEKLVKGQLDSTYTKYPQTGSSVPGGISDYKLTVKNTGNIPVDSIIIVDILPFVNDTGVVDLTARLSRWSPNLVSTVQAPAGVTVYYSTEKNPCRAAEGLVPSGPPSCSPPNWNTSPPADLTMVQSLKFEFGQNTLYPNDSVQLNWAMRVPVNALATIGAAPDSIAWNSFGFIGKRTDNGLKTLPSEPLKVGINLTDIVPNVYGDKVWNDTNQNGIQDLGESGINGIRVELYKDNNNGIIEPNLDTFINFTLTGNGGYYLFPNLDDGNYYAVFYQPNAYSISPNDMGGNDGIDSDGSPLTVNGFPATITPITNLSGLEYDLTWDQGFYPSPNGAIGNYVWNDGNGDGIQNEAAALGVNGIWIYLYDNATPSVILDSTITQNDVNGNPGHYYFDNIPAGNYFLEMKLPTDVSITSLGTTGSSDPLDSDFDVATHRTEVFVVTSGTYDENWDLGLILSGIENCSNGIDDDLDGLTDCQDIDDCTPIANPATLNTCDNSNGAGSGSFILHDANPTVSVESGVIISYHPTLVNANNNANILISPYPSSSGILYARVERISSGCFNTAAITLTVGAKCAENCNNNLDEDGDGLIDCNDPDCPCCHSKAPIISNPHSN